MTSIKPLWITRLLTLTTLAALPGCIIETDSPNSPPVYSGCPSLEGSFIDGSVSLHNEAGGFFSLESYTYEGYYVRHADGQGMISLIETGLDMDDATFRVVPGLADDRCVSFESWNYPGSYLRQDHGEVWLDDGRAGGLFQEDATFCPRLGLADSHALSFESCNAPGMYLHHTDDILYVGDGSGWAFEEDATFLLTDPWSP
ncbi:AbfB domain-containing protein [Stigmatella sp. ncwal1]|uniref:AbfB domain-containing protein n=1 Tax=Stigmatella ashevillensis TaxID=2995309 RepID=A0ABT5D3T6_9BACT|nr:AbfB domain-containing protein [Stigmatella ashevillena]MDC0708231.1 AbfB domain-containing protein [Stigmatella ashevillena]